MEGTSLVPRPHRGREPPYGLRAKLAGYTVNALKCTETSLVCQPYWSSSNTSKWTAS